MIGTGHRPEPVIRYTARKLKLLPSPASCASGCRTQWPSMSPSNTASGEETSYSVRKSFTIW